MTECRAFFEELDAECQAKGTNKIRGERLRGSGADRYARLLEWEKQAASAYSPGPVSSTECLRKALYEGQDVVDGQMNRNAFGSLDDLGLSADRCNLVDQATSVARFAQSRAVQRGKPLHGYIEMSAEHLRGLKPKPEANEQSTPAQAIGIYDTALAENTAHCEAFMLYRASNTKPLRSLQMDLVDKYKQSIIRYQAADR